MKLIETLSYKISEEISDAKHYAEMAVEYKDTYPDLARTLYGLSQDEMNHMGILHNAVVEIINQYRSEHGDPPVSMQAVYDYLHEQQIKKATEVKSLQLLYKG